MIDMIGSDKPDFQVALLWSDDQNISELYNIDFPRVRDTYFPCGSMRMQRLQDQCGKPQNWPGSPVPGRRRFTMWSNVEILDMEKHNGTNVERMETNAPIFSNLKRSVRTEFHIRELAA